MGRCLLKHSTLELSEDDEGQQDDDEEDDGDGDADQDCGVVGVCADGLGPRRLTKLCLTGECANLIKLKNLLRDKPGQNHYFNLT